MPVLVSEPPSSEVLLAHEASVTPMTSAVATTTDVNGVVASAPFTLSFNEVIVTLSNVAGRRLRVGLTGVNGALSAAASVGFLPGDVDGSGTVTASDILRTRGREGQSDTPSNFLYDVNLDGSITSADRAAVKAQSGTTLR